MGVKSFTMVTPISFPPISVAPKGLTTVDKVLAVALASFLGLSILGTLAGCLFLAKRADSFFNNGFDPLVYIDENGLQKVSPRNIHELLEPYQKDMDENLGWTWVAYALISDSKLITEGVCGGHHRITWEGQHVIAEDSSQGAIGRFSMFGSPTFPVTIKKHLVGSIGVEAISDDQRSQLEYAVLSGKTPADETVKDLWDKLKEIGDVLKKRYEPQGYHIDADFPEHIQKCTSVDEVFYAAIEAKIKDDHLSCDDLCSADILTELSAFLALTVLKHSVLQDGLLYLAPDVAVELKEDMFLGPLELMDPEIEVFKSMSFGSKLLAMKAYADRVNVFRIGALEDDFHKRFSEIALKRFIMPYLRERKSSLVQDWVVPEPNQITQSQLNRYFKKAEDPHTISNICFFAALFKSLNPELSFVANDKVAAFRAKIKEEILNNIDRYAKMDGAVQMHDCPYDNFLGPPSTDLSFQTRKERVHRHLERVDRFFSEWVLEIDQEAAARILGRPICIYNYDEDLVLHDGKPHPHEIYGNDQKGKRIHLAFRPHKLHYHSLIPKY